MAARIDMALFGDKYSIRLHRVKKTKTLDIPLTEFLNDNSIYTLYVRDYKEVVSNLAQTFEIEWTNKKNYTTFMINGKMTRVIFSKAHIQYNDEGDDNTQLQAFIDGRNVLLNTLKGVSKDLGDLGGNIKLNPTIASTALRFSRTIIKKQTDTYQQQVIFGRKGFKIDPEHFLYLKNYTRAGYIYKSEGTDEKDIYTYDLNSAYPNHLRKDIPIIRQIGSFREPGGTYKDYMILNIKSWSIKPEWAHMPPMLRVRDIMDTEPRYSHHEKYSEGYTYPMWEDEYKYLMKFYDIEYTIDKTYTWLMGNPFKELVERLYKDKYTNVNIKMILNSLVGKMGQFYGLDECENEKEMFKLIKSSITPPIQIPSYIFSQTRLQLWQAVEKNKVKLIASHTDSIIVDKPIDNFRAASRDLGDWGFEGHATDAKWFAINNYMFYLSKNIIFKGNITFNIEALTKEMEKRNETKFKHKNKTYNLQDLKQRKEAYNGKIKINKEKSKNSY